MIKTLVLQNRIETLKKMDNYICESIEDEYIWETWISLGVPDCADEEDFEDIAEDNESYVDIRDLFVRLVNYETLVQLEREC